MTVQPSPNPAVAELLELAKQASALLQPWEPLVADLRAKHTQAIALDQFGLYCSNLAEGFRLLADRAHREAEAILDTEE